MTELFQFDMQYLWGIVVAFAAMTIVTPLVIRLAGYMGWVARPKEDRWHEKPTALMGGIAIYVAATIATLLFAQETWHFIVWGGASVMFLTGLIDDLYSIKPISKLIFQILATGILILGGFQFLSGAPFWISIPLTFLWVIGITNAVNLLDNMDGLSAGISGIAAFVFAIFAVVVGNPEHILFLGPIAGASFGFLLFNFKPARIFMGDCGSLFLGFSIATGGLLLQDTVGTAGTISILLLPIAVTAVPIFDTTLVTIGRILSGRSVSQGGRDHSSHRLVFLGLSERASVLSLYGISLLFGGLAVVFQFMELHLFVSLLILLIVVFTVFGIFLGRLQVYKDQSDEHHVNEEIVNQPVLKMMVRYKKIIFGLLADLGIVSACFILAFYIRFEAQVTDEMLSQIHLVLPIVIMVKLFFFYVFGLYRGIWRHAGTPELLRIFGANITASVALILLMHTGLGFELYSYSVYVIDFLLAMFLVGAIRLLFRGFNQFFASQQDGVPVVLYGAGAGGMLSLREIRQNDDLKYQPMAFVDDDETLYGSYVQGLPVYDSDSGLKELLHREEIETILITTGKMSDEKKQRLHQFCEKYNITCREFYVGFRKLEEEPEEKEVVETV